MRRTLSIVVIVGSELQVIQHLQIAPQSARSKVLDEEVKGSSALVEVFLVSVRRTAELCTPT